MKLVVSHPTGNANVRAIITGILEAGMLEKFFTTITYFEKSRRLKSFIKDINRREFSESLRPYTVTHPWPEIGRHILNKLGLQYLTNKEFSPFGIDAVYKSLDQYLAKKISSLKNIQGVYAYEDGSFYTFKAAKKNGLKCIYELPIAYWQTGRKLLLEEAERLPEWKKTIEGGIADSQQKLDRKVAELEMADMIITPSQFVADSLPKWAGKKQIILAQFGSPNNAHFYKRIRRKSLNGKLRVLFAGSMTQRKGLADLFAAFQLLGTNNAELIVLGSLMESISFYKKKYPSFKYEPPRMHQQVLALMESCDVLCLPSIIEGRALVMQEAMSRGLPVIITSNTGGVDLVKEGETGFLVPIRSPEAIADKISWFLENRSLLQFMEEASYKHATNYTWANYSKTIIDAVRLQTD